jgi:hypothetical protein
MPSQRCNTNTIAKVLDQTHAEPENERYGKGEFGEEDDGIEDVEIGKIDLGHQLAMEFERGAFIDYLRSEPIKLTITSNGYSIGALDDAEVGGFQDIEFSLDYPTEGEQDRQRGPGNWRLIHQQAARCRKLGVSVTFIAVMMRSNYNRLAEIAKIAKAYDAPLRINVYQAVRSDVFVLRSIPRRGDGSPLHQCLEILRWRHFSRGRHLGKTVV